MGLYIGLRLCSRCSGYASGHAKPSSGLHSHNSELLSHGSGKPAACSGLETEMVSLRREKSRRFARKVGRDLSVYGKAAVNALEIGLGKLK